MATMKIKLISHISFALLIALTSPLLFVVGQSRITDNGDLPPPQNYNFDFNSEIENAKFKLDQLELRFEMTNTELDSKDTDIMKHEKQIEELIKSIRRLESDLSHVKEPPEYAHVVNAFEEQVQELEAGVRENDKELQLLKRRAEASEKKVDSLATQVKTIAVIVSELWLHIQKLEQAQEVIERRTAELRRHIRNQKCSFFKFINSFGGRRYHKMVAPYTSEALNSLKKSLVAAKKYHHQLQAAVKREMDKHELTAVLAGEESVFLLASIILVFPIMLARIWLSSHWR